MLRAIPIVLCCSLLLSAQSHGQDVFVPRQSKALPKLKKEEPPEAESQKPVATNSPEVSESKKAESEKAPAKKDPAENSHSARANAIKFEAVRAISTKEPAPSSLKEKVHPAKAESSKASATNDPAVAEPGVRSTKTESTKKTAPKESVASSSTEKTHSQEVEAPKPAPVESAKSTTKKSVASTDSDKKQPVKSEPAPAKESTVSVHSEKGTKSESAKEPATKATASKQPAAEKVRSAKVEAAKPLATKETQEEPRSDKGQVAKTEPTKAAAKKEKGIAAQSEKEETKGKVSVMTTKEPDVTLSKSEPIKASLDQGSNSNSRLSTSMETASTRLADGFDFPVGKPEAEGYDKARGFRPNGHSGEDWDGVRGGDTDLKDPIYSIGDGIVVFARDVHMGWGRVVIVRHGYKEDGGVRYIDSLYGHLDTIMVKRGQKVRRGQQIATMGTAHGQYDAHLHFEIRKNIEIGMSKSKFTKNYSNYFSPTDFIVAHRRVAGGGATFRVAMNTFTHDAAYNFDNARNYSARKRSTAESSSALRRALSSAPGSDRD